MARKSGGEGKEMSEKAFEYQEIETDLVPDMGEGVDVWGSRDYTEKILQEKKDDTQAEMGGELDRVQRARRKMGALAVVAGGIEGKIDRFWTPEREAKAAA